MDTGDTNQQQPDGWVELSDQESYSSLLDDQNDMVYFRTAVHARSLAGHLGDYTDPEEDSKLWSFEDYSLCQGSALPQINNPTTNTSVGMPRSRNGPITMNVDNGSTELTFVQMIDRQSILSSLLSKIIHHPSYNAFQADSLQTTTSSSCSMFHTQSIQPNLTSVVCTGARPANLRCIASA